MCKSDKCKLPTRCKKSHVKKHSNRHKIFRKWVKLFNKNLEMNLTNTQRWKFEYCREALYANNGVFEEYQLSMDNCYIKHISINSNHKFPEYNKQKKIHHDDRRVYTRLFDSGITNNEFIGFGMNKLLNSQNMDNLI